MKTLGRLLLTAGLTLNLCGCPEIGLTNPTHTPIVTPTIKPSNLYEDFSSEIFNTEKWEIRQDYEGQPLIADSGLDIANKNFHTAQSSVVGDHRTYLVPKYKFKTGDTFEFDIDLISANGNSIAMLLVDNQHRIGLGGCWDGVCHLFQKYNIKLEFGDSLIRITGNIVNADVSINSNPEHEIYIGTVFGHNGTGHIDYDNFKLY